MDLERFIVSLTRQLVEAKTVNYNPEDYPSQGPDQMASPGEEYKVVDILKKYLDDWGISYETVAKDAKRPNLIARIGQGKKGYRKLLLVLHTDTVPAGPREAWKTDPFKVIEKDGKLYGRGVLDNKGPLASVFAILPKLREANLPGQVVFAACADEEMGGGFGMDVVLEKGIVKDCTDAIIPDIAGNMKEINIAEKGRLLLKVEVQGKSAHAMHPEKGINAIYAASRYLAKMDGYTLSHEPHEVLDPPTINTGMIKGGTAPNVVAEKCTITQDIRYLPGQTPEGIKAELEDLARKANYPGASFHFSIQQVMPPSAVPSSAPIVQLVKKYAPDAKLVGSGGITFAKPLVLAGIDAVGWAPGDEATYHQPNEEIEIAQLVTFSQKILALCKEASQLPIE